MLLAEFIRNQKEIILQQWETFAQRMTFIVDQIVSAHKGTIAVTSSKDAGTTLCSAAATSVIVYTGSAASDI